MSKPAVLPSRCEKHDLYHSTEQCWKCRAEDPLTVAEDTTPHSIDETLRTLGIDTAPEEGVPLPAEEDNQFFQPARPRRLVPPARAVPGVVTDFLKTAKLGAGQSGLDILEVCLELAAFLLEKNAAYGDSALDPVRIISTADPAEQIRVRIDDKLSRLLRGKAAGEDALKDLVGYWVLLQVAEKRVKAT